MALIKIRRGRWQYDKDACVGLALDLAIYDDDGRPALLPHVVEGEDLAAVQADPKRLKDIVLKLGAAHLAAQADAKAASARPVDLLDPGKYEPSQADIVEETAKCLKDKEKASDGKQISADLG